MKEILVHSHSVANRLDLFEKQVIGCSTCLCRWKDVSFTLGRLVVRKRGRDFHDCLFGSFYLIIGLSYVNVLKS